MVKVQTIGLDFCCIFGRFYIESTKNLKNIDPETKSVSRCADLDQSEIPMLPLVCHWYTPFPE